MADRNRFYIDMEYTPWVDRNRFVLSLGIISERGAGLYIKARPEDIEDIAEEGFMDPWVAENVLPIMDSVPADITPIVLPIFKDGLYNLTEWGAMLQNFAWHTPMGAPEFVADFTTDLHDIIEMIGLHPTTIINTGDLTRFTLLRHIDVYPTSLVGAVQHNAWWDAMALRHYCLTNNVG